MNVTKQKNKRLKSIKTENRKTISETENRNKTLTFEAMKTKNNVQKTILRSKEQKLPTNYTNFTNFEKHYSNVAKVLRFTLRCRG